MTNTSSNRVSVLLGNNDWTTPLTRPIATLVGPGGLLNQSLGFTLGATGAGLPVDTVFTFAIDWNGDGAADETVSGTDGRLVEHMFAAAGTYAVGMIATDPNYNTSLPVAVKVQVLPVMISVQPDPINPALSALVIVAKGALLGEAPNETLACSAPPALYRLTASPLVERPTPEPL